MRPSTRISIGHLLVGALIIIAGTGGCSDNVQSGSDVQKLESFKIEKNKTTEQELVANFGPPASTMTNSDGSKVLTWSGVEGQGHGAGSWGTAMLNIVPGGIFFAHENMQTNSSSISVTIRDGVVVDYNVIESNQNQKMY
jgi:hypothetical protein